MKTEISKVYDKSRDELIQYEDSEFALLTSHVPNFYISRNDQTHWGGFLRTIASELGRLEYFHASDLMSKDPNFLNPADIRRVWNAPLFINRNYPSDTQFDQDYKTLIINLLSAYREGATVKSVTDVISSYTDQAIVVHELFKFMAQAPYDMSYRNTITVSVPILKLGDEKTSAYANKLYTISHDLYGAIDLAKPAHVGLQLGLVLGGKDDQFRAIIDDVETVGVVSSLPHAWTYPDHSRICLWETSSENLYQLGPANEGLQWDNATRPINSYILANNVLYQFNGTNWNQVYEPGCDPTSVTQPHYYYNGSSWVYGVEPVVTTLPRYCAGLRFIANFEENPLPSPLFEAPFYPRPSAEGENKWTYPHADTGLATNSAVHAAPYYGVNPGFINVFGVGFDTGSPSVEFATSDLITWPSGWATADIVLVSDQQLRVTIPIDVVSGPIKVTINSVTHFTPFDFSPGTTPVFYPIPGVLSPQLNRTWEIKSDNVDILGID